MNLLSSIVLSSNHLYIDNNLGLTIFRSLKRELVRAQEEIKRIQSVPLVIGQFLEPIDQKYARTSRSFSTNRLNV